MKFAAYIWSLVTTFLQSAKLGYILRPIPIVIHPILGVTLWMLVTVLASMNRSCIKNILLPLSFSWWEQHNPFLWLLLQWDHKSWQPWRHTRPELDKIYLIKPSFWTEDSDEVLVTLISPAHFKLFLNIYPKLIL